MDKIDMIGRRQGKTHSVIEKFLGNIDKYVILVATEMDKNVMCELLIKKGLKYEVAFKSVFTPYSPNLKLNRKKILIDDLDKVLFSAFGDVEYIAM
jgi:hypothetical protein